MKKSLLALAVAAFAASSASAATVYDKDGTSMDVYGRVQAVVYSQDHCNTSASGDAGLVGSGRLGIQVNTNLTDGIDGFAKAEWDVADSDANDHFSARYIWVGADFGQFGQIKGGRFEDAVYYGVTSVTDIYEDAGCNGHLGSSDKRDGEIMYTWSGYGVDFAASYGTAKDGQRIEGAWFGNGESDADVKNGFAVALGYTSPDVLFGPIAVKAGYGYVRFQDDNGNYSYTHQYDNYKQWSGALSWGSADVGPYAVAMYSVRDFTMNDVSSHSDYKVQGVEALLGYGFECGLNILASWQWMNIDYDDDGSESYDSDAYTIPVLVTYNFNQNFKVWAEARFDIGTDSDFYAASNESRDYEQNVYSVGARYTF